MPQSERNRRVVFRLEQVMEAVLRMTNLFEEFIRKIISSQFKRFSLAVGKSSIVWEGYWMQNNAKSTLLKSLQSIALCSGQIVVPYHAAVFND